MFIDTHAHLNDERLKPYIAEVAEDMVNSNLSYIINVGWDMKSSEEAIEIADKYEKMYAVIGIHPHDSKKVNKKDYQLLENYSKNPKVVAFGEIGLDFFYDHSARDIQEKVFREQIEIADSISLPIVLHVRDAYQKIYDILFESQKYLNSGLVLHCYSGSAEMVRRFADFDAYFSLGGVITFNNSKKEPVVAAIPRERLLLETDCPYMTPVPYRGEINYPKYIRFVAEKLQEWLPGVEIGELTSINAKRLFKKLKG